MKKIMQCLMGLDIGGAETHVVELSKSLAAQGYEVVVASNGGIYERELIEAGVGVLTIPMHTKNPAHVLKSLLTLHRELKRFKPDIVHAHARIPALYVSIMKKFHSFKMMTTVHGNFKVNWLLKRLTQWGEDIFVVSEDVESYLKEHYTLKGQIHRTVNGIDTQKFHETSVSYPYRRLIHVGRLEDNTSKMAYALLDLAKKIPMEIVIVGGGSELENLKQKAATLSNITFTGAVDKVAELLKEGDVFVGISRAALEAMCMNLPVILGGEYGYLGILDENKLKLAIKTNFTARVPEQLSLERLYGDLMAISKIPPSAFQWERSFIKTHYSVSKMVTDYTSVYERSNRIFIIGYYGSNNLGDELLLKETIALIKPYAELEKVSVLSYHVEQTEAMHGVKSISRNKFLTIVKTILQSDVLIGGGGSMLQNVTSNRSLIYYLSLIRLGLIFNKKVLILGNGIGPIHGKVQTAMAKKTLESIDLLHLRDQSSFDWIGGAAHSHMILGQDLALLAEPHQSPANKKTKKVIVNLRKWPDVAYLTRALEPFLKTLEERGYEVSFLCMQVGNDDHILSKLGRVKQFDSLSDLEDEVASASLAIGMRLHTLILCANYNVPFLGLSYDPKVKAFCSHMGMPYLESFKTVTEEAVRQAFEYLELNAETLTEGLTEKRKEASLNHQRLKSVLNQEIQP